MRLNGNKEKGQLQQQSTIKQQTSKRRWLLQNDKVIKLRRSLLIRNITVENKFNWK